MPSNSFALISVSVDVFRRDVVTVLIVIVVNESNIKNIILHLGNSKIIPNFFYMFFYYTPNQRSKKLSRRPPSLGYLWVAIYSLAPNSFSFFPQMKFAVTLFAIFVLVAGSRASHLIEGKKDTVKTEFRRSLRDSDSRASH